MSTKVLSFEPVEEVEFVHRGVRYGITEPTLAELEPYKAFASKNAVINQSTKEVRVNNAHLLEPLIFEACIKRVEPDGSLAPCKREEFNTFSASMVKKISEECRRVMGEETTEEEKEKEEIERGNE